MDYSIVVSIFALSISAISLFISWRQYSRDNSRLKLSLEFHLKSGQGSGYTLRIVNTGRRPVTIYKCYARLKSGKVYPASVGERYLDETEPWEIFISLNTYKDLIGHPLDIVAFEVEETTGRISKIKTKKVRKEIRKVWTSETDWLKKTESKRS
jgi:hypothetical protein